MIASRMLDSQRRRQQRVRLSNTSNTSSASTGMRHEVHGPRALPSGRPHCVQSPRRAAIATRGTARITLPPSALQPELARAHLVRAACRRAAPVRPTSRRSRRSGRRRATAVDVIERKPVVGPASAMTSSSPFSTCASRRHVRHLTLAGRSARSRRLGRAGRDASTGAPNVSAPARRSRRSRSARAAATRGSGRAPSSAACWTCPSTTTSCWPPSAGISSSADRRAFVGCGPPTGGLRLERLCRTSSTSDAWLRSCSSRVSPTRYSAKASTDDAEDREPARARRALRAASGPARRRLRCRDRLRCALRARPRGQGSTDASVMAPRAPVGGSSRFDAQSASSSGSSAARRTRLAVLPRPTTTPIAGPTMSGREPEREDRRASTKLPWLPRKSHAQRFGVGRDPRPIARVARVVAAAESSPATPPAVAESSNVSKSESLKSESENPPLSNVSEVAAEVERVGGGRIGRLGRGRRWCRRGRRAPRHPRASRPAPSARR